ncbi:MAG: D-2-hydroxyacid dehydrogenase [Ilumatobacteraceae bacterium]
MTVERSTLLCTDTVAERFADRIAAAAPDLDVVAIQGDDLVAPEDLARVDIAFFSADSFPARSQRFMGAAIRAPRLRWLHTFSAGTDHPVFATLRERGVRLTSSSGASAGPIARTVVLYLLALSRDLPRLLADQAAHRWDPRNFDDVDGRTIGVVGMGPIGREIIRLAAALGMRPIGMRRRILGDEPCETWTIDRLAELAAAVDVLAVALPLTDDTRGIVSADVIAGMRPDSVFVNVGRGELVDEIALTAALVGGHVGGAGLDVFATEPLPPDSPLWDLPNVIVTPHSSGQTASTGWGAAEIFLDNLGRYVRGETLVNER